MCAGVMADVFISYSRADVEAARRFARAFEALGFSVWWDVALRSGETFDEAIEQALRAAKAVVVLWSPNSIGSRWVRTEATIADRNGTLAPVMIDACERPIAFELTHTADLKHWNGDAQDEAWQTLAADVRKLVEARAEPKAAMIAQTEAPVAKDTRPAILVLPFVNMSGDTEQEYFSDGVTEDIITDLSKIGALIVVSRSTSFTYKGRTVAAAQLARELRVSHILEGSVRKSGVRVRITAQLLDAKTDAQIWAERYDRTLDDIFAIQDEISQAIVEALKLKLAPEEKRAIEQRSTTNSEAYELYLMARQFTRAGSERLKPIIIRICKKIVELDSGFAAAWALMSLAESEMSQRGIAGYSNASAREAADRAVAADPNCADAYAALAESIIRGPTMDSEAGWPIIEKALALDPDCFDANLAAGNSSIGTRNFSRAVHYFERAISLDPMSYHACGMVVQAYHGMGDQESRLAAARRALATCELILAREPDHSGALGFLVNALVSLGEVDRARVWAARATLFDPDNARMRYNLACAMSECGDAELACDLLDGIIDRVSKGWLLWIDQDNDLDPIREHARFKAIVARGKARFEKKTKRTKQTDG